MDSRYFRLSEHKTSLFFYRSDYQGFFSYPQGFVFYLFSLLFYLSFFGTNEERNGKKAKYLAIRAPGTTPHRKKCAWGPTKRSVVPSRWEPEKRSLIRNDWRRLERLIWINQLSHIPQGFLSSGPLKLKFEGKAARACRRFRHAFCERALFCLKCARTYPRSLVFKIAPLFKLFIWCREPFVREYFMSRARLTDAGPFPRFGQKKPPPGALRGGGVVAGQCYTAREQLVLSELPVFRFGRPLWPGEFA